MKYLKMLSLAAVAAMALFAVVGASAASATTLSVGGVTQNKSVSIAASLLPGTSALLVDTAGTTLDTCTNLEFKVATEGSFTGASVGGKVSTMTFGGCSHTTKVIAPGSLSIAWTSGTNGTVTSSGAETTIQSTVFGVSAICKTGAGTDLGTLTGVASGNSTLHIDFTKSLDCGAFLGKTSMTGTYRLTSPSGLGVES